MNEASGLPPAWSEQFDGADLDRKLGVSAVLATTDEEHWPHITYLSAGEILAHSDDRLTLTLWPTSRSTANIDRTGRAVLHAVADGVVWETRLSLTRRRSTGKDDLATFEGRIVDVRRHAAPYAHVQSLIDFRLYEPAQTLARWEEQVAAMRGRS